MGSRLGLVGGVIVALVLSGTVGGAAQADQTLGTVRIPVKVTANGQSLAAGTYTLRLSSDPVSSVAGQGADAARWVEFLQAGQVKGRELASVIAPADVKAVAKRTPPAALRPVAHTLRGADYLRVWVNRGGTQYLLHLVR